MPLSCGRRRGSISRGGDSLVKSPRLYLHREPPQIDEVDPVIDFWEEELLPGEVNAFQVHAAMFRVAERETESCQTVVFV